MPPVVRSRPSAEWRDVIRMSRSKPAYFEIRIGIHVGDIIVEEGEYFRDGVNIAARLEGIAEPGGICLSDDTFRQVRGKIDVAFEDAGGFSSSKL